MKKFSMTSITVHIWSVFISLIIVIFVCLLLFHNIFYEQFYLSLKKQELVNQSTNIKDIYLNDNYTAELDTLSFNENISIALFYVENDVIKTIYDPKKIQTLQQAYNIISESGKNIEQYNEETENEDGIIACITSFVHEGEIIYVYANSPMVGSIIALTINQYQIVISATITIMFGIIVAYFFSKFLSRPISDLNDAAFKLSNGDYEVTFPQDGYDEIKQLGESLNKAKDELMKTDSLQKEFIANVSHDLRTPLTIIQSYAEMIRDLSGDNKEKREKHLEVIINEVNRLSSLVTDVLEITKITANIKQVNLQNVNLSKLIMQVIEKVKLPLLENNINIINNIDDNIYAFIDEISFNQVVYNFILNAITYTKDTIEIKLYKDQDKIIFNVIDNGIGIKEEEINSIWERYFRSKDNHERHKHGSGLGLSIVKKILDQHNFEYGVKSIYNEGANFYVIIKEENLVLKEM